MTLDFIFALLLGMGFTIVFFALTMTLSYVEVAQYISFAVARSSWAAHETRTLQLALGNRKYSELIARPVFKSIFGKGWFTLPAQPNYGDPLRGFNDEYSVDPATDNETFIGARLQVKAKILSVNLPLLGESTTKAETGVANVQTFLGREVTTTECREQFNAVRFDEIVKLKSAGGPTPYQEVLNKPGGAATAVALITDNGC